jgi:superfamily I DNA/RNA helicase
MALTDEQIQALWVDDKPAQDFRIISARPGTGKTTTLTQYCIDLAEDWRENHDAWQGLAAISYTNVAKEELERKVKELGRANTLLSAPHFVGTIDSFVNQYIFLPFGSQSLGCAHRPRLVGEPFSPWRPSGAQYANKPPNAYSPVFFDAYSVDKNDNPVRTDTVLRQVTRDQARQAVPATNINASKIMDLKRYIWQDGNAVQNDANYIAYKVLLDNPALTRHFITRFPVLIIDEAQDMTELQHAIIDHLKAAGQKHIVIIGDEYQAIYEWNTAKPQLFTEKTTQEDWVSHSLTYTFRCSAPICRSLNILSSDGIDLKPASDSKNIHYTNPVKVIGYSPDIAQQDLEIKVAIDKLAEELTSKIPHDGEEGDLRLAVLTRSRDDVDRLQAIFTGVTVRSTKPIIWSTKSTREYTKVIHYLARKNTYQAFKAYENLLFNLAEYEDKPLMRQALAKLWGDDEPSPIAYRNTIFADLKKINNLIPSTQEIRISDCSNICPQNLTAISTTHMTGLKTDYQSFSTGSNCVQDRSITSLMTSRDERVPSRHTLYKNVVLLFSTIHGVKGETYDGVLFYGKERTSPCTCAPAKALWRDIVTHPLITCENKRLIYVAFSRAAQILNILCPEDQKQVWEALTTGVAS